MGLMRGTRVFVGLSGGVDSAVSAAFLKDAGADVTGVFIKGWYPPGLPCTWAEDRRDAMRVAAHLRIPFVTLDAHESYRESVLEYLIREYRAGRTPNPDIMCNRNVKFGVFYEYAIKRGAAYIATGHYARVDAGRLFRGKDSEKDQSYFLWAVAAEALRHTLFPLGEFTKREVRMRARRFKLPVADKKDSQGICFLGPVSVEDYLRTELSLTKGRALDEDGREVGEHESALLFTLGERARLNHAAPGPWYVVHKHLDRNELIVSRTKRAQEELRMLTLSATNRIGQWEEATSAQYRYHGPVIDGVFTVSDNTFTANRPFPESVAPGQSLVLYRNDECLGGGIIE